MYIVCVCVKFPGIYKVVYSYLLNMSPRRKRWKEREKEGRRERKFLSGYNIQMKKKKPPLTWGKFSSVSSSVSHVSSEKISIYLLSAVLLMWYKSHQLFENNSQPVSQKTTIDQIISHDLTRCQQRLLQPRGVVWITPLALYAYILSFSGGHCSRVC